MIVIEWIYLQPRYINENKNITGDGFEFNPYL